MNKIINNELDRPFHLDEIPKKLHNITFTQEQLDRLSQGLPTGLIEGIVFEDGSIENAKISLSKNSDTDKLEINYNFKEENLAIPDKIFDVLLTSEQKNKIINGELLGGFTMNGQSIYIGLDPELNKVVVKTQRELKIPNELLNYTLDPVDKMYLSNGKMTDERLFKTNKGDYFTARVSLTIDKKGIELVNIKSISQPRALEIKDILNASKVVKDDQFLLNMPGITANQEHSKQTYKPIEKVVYKRESLHNIKIQRERHIIKSSPNEHSTQVTIENKKTSKSIHQKKEKRVYKRNGKTYTHVDKPKVSYVQYENVTGGADGFTITPKNKNAAFLKATFKDVHTTAQQRSDFIKGREVLIKGANFGGDIKDVIVFKDNTGSFQTRFLKDPLTKVNTSFERGL